MKVYTRTGDKGTTSIVGGQRLPKDAPRIEAYGTVDELNSHLGVLVASSDCPEVQRQTLLRIQSLLFNLGSYLAGVPQTGITDSDISAIEQSIDQMSGQLPELRSFILPGGCTLAAAAHVARTVCRRAERCIVTLMSTMEVAPEAITLVNRLSDWLYIFARYVNVLSGTDEHPWIPSK